MEIFNKTGSVRAVFMPLTLLNTILLVKWRSALYTTACSSRLDPISHTVANELGSVSYFPHGKHFVAVCPRGPTWSSVVFSPQWWSQSCLQTAQIYWHSLNWFHQLILQVTCHHTVPLLTWTATNDVRINTSKTKEMILASLNLPPISQLNALPHLNYW